VKSAKLGMDYLHVAVDHHSRIAFVRVFPDEKGATCAAFLLEAAEFFASLGVTIRRVMTDNALNYRNSCDFQAALQLINAKHITTRPYSPWQTSKAERFNRSLQDGWAYRRAFTSNQERLEALQPWIEHQNYDRPHTACAGLTPISRLSPTSWTGYCERD
jgi:transposase InsO family protein